MSSTSRFSNVYKRFWGRPLTFSQITTHDEENGQLSFNVLEVDYEILSTTNGRLIARQEYLDIVHELESHHATFATAGTIVVGHPGIGKCLRDGS